MTWLLWIILGVLFWFTLRFAPTGNWLSLDFRVPWDPRNGHPDGGPTEAEQDEIESWATIDAILNARKRYKG